MKQFFKQNLLTICLSIATTVGLFWYINYVAENAQQNIENRLFDENYSRVFQVQNPGEPRKHGTGTLIKGASNTSYILTNAHVCRMTGDLAVVANLSTYFTASVVYSNKQQDICLLKPNKELTLNSVKIAKEEAYLNQVVYTIGFPRNYPLSLKRGNVIGPYRDFTEEVYVDQKNCVAILPNPQTKILSCLYMMDFMLTSFTAYGGNSGSPVLNQDGELVGLLSLAVYQTQYGGYIFLNEIKKVLNKY